jgi:transposase
MFTRIKRSGGHEYLQVVENRREGSRTVQRVLQTLGRLDTLRETGKLDVLVRSLSRFSVSARHAEAVKERAMEAGAALEIGMDHVVARLWGELGMPAVLTELLGERKFSFSVERAAYLSVLHRLCESGSDRQADRWRRDVRIEGVEKIKLHHLYRAMRFLGKQREQIEEALFAHRRTLFSSLTLAFFDTTSLYFEGKGGTTIGRRGFSKDHRPDLKQMILGAVLDEEGRPICTDMQPGNTADIKAFLPVVDRLRKKFGVTDVCWVADRGMISAETIMHLEKHHLHYILGARMRKQKEVRDTVLARAGRYRTVAGNLRVKEVMVQGKRYVVCRNPDQATKDKADREAILASLEEQLRSGAKSLVGNKGYRKFLSVKRGAVSINERKIREEERYDGLFVLRTNADLTTEQVALQYKRLLLVERFFRDAKSLLDTRPIFHHFDATIMGHVFVSFLALLIKDELLRRIKAKGCDCEWPDILRDLKAVKAVDVREGGQTYMLRTALQGCAGKIFQAVGVAPPPSVMPPH